MLKQYCIAILSSYDIIKGMIKQFADKPTAAIFSGLILRKMDRRLQEKARLKLQQIDNATQLDDLRNPPSNRLERKSGNMKHLHCLRVNKQWRICFEWVDGHAYKVQLTDYH
jgi:proteic killer suppression protein